VLVNAGRGAVIDNQALLQRLTTRQDLSCVLDVWEGEPRVNMELLGRCALATPHIAGYSYDGKVAGTAMIASACRDYFSLQTEPQPFVDEPKSIRAFGDNTWSAFCGLVRNAYNIMADDQRFREQMSTASHADERAKRFDLLRKTYPVRREWLHYQVGLSNRPDIAQLGEMVKNVGFSTK
jgi:erythronate-4-phosphate dehydrogenase